MATINHETVAAFLAATNSTNFQIIARGNSLDGAVAPVIKVQEQRTPQGDLKTEVLAQYSGRMDSGQKKSVDSALNAAKGGDYARACDLLMDSYFYQVEVRSLASIVSPNIFGDQANPLAGLESLIWRAEPRLGRPSQGRSYRLQATITPELAAWLETQKSGDSLSDVVYRLLDGLRQADTQ